MGRVVHGRVAAQAAQSLSGEVRFVHSDSHGSWTLNNLNGQLNYNELNIVENQFINEFRIAQNNLFANVAAGKGNTFAYTGAPGTSPLPIFLAHLNGSTASGDASKYTGTGWTNSTLVQSMYKFQPEPVHRGQPAAHDGVVSHEHAERGAPDQLLGRQPRRQRGDRGDQRRRHAYNGIQLLLNRRFANGFLAQANYTYGRGYQQDFYSFRKPYVERRQTITNSPEGAGGGVTHALAVNWVYELPFGRGKRFGRMPGRCCTG